MLSDRYSKQAQKQIKKIDWGISKKIIQKIQMITVSPLPPEAKRCKEEKFRENVFLISMNSYDVIYELDFEEKTLLVHKISEIKKVERICSHCLSAFCDE
ncbi:MAG: type II toxin-antitoxin system RelE/ParE family toxin [Nanoarchaeota archaeon]|jgi:mRNA-degrading endonuclease RelE of RelBE toxin-antitoxin system|nr:type II toxin-antitoxin system RelE/ParE family toxin [Nanoarchaeota archaeon]